jgi:hypothetical protein
MEVANQQDGITNDTMFLTSSAINRSANSATLDVKLTNDFSNTNPSLDTSIYVKGTWIEGPVNFNTSVGNVTGSLGQFTNTFESYGSLPEIYNGGVPYTLTMDLGFTTPGNQGYELVDDYSVDVAVATPEPGTLLLLGSGLAGLAGLGARRRQ